MGSATVCGLRSVAKPSNPTAEHRTESQTCCVSRSWLHAPRTARWWPAAGVWERIGSSRLTSGAIRALEGEQRRACRGPRFDVASYRPTAPTGWL
eukprot:373831-Rhodomonas_salina.2